MTCLGVELDTATLRIRPIAILVSAELTIPYKSFLCHLGCIASTAGISFVFLYTIIACLSDFYENFCKYIVFLSNLYDTVASDVELRYPQM